jgi:hypothetical protein
MYDLGMPADFRPEDHGWEVRNPVVPHQQHEMDMYALNHWGFVPTFYLRTEIPFVTPAALVVIDRDKASGRWHVLYNPPVTDMERTPAGGEIRREIREGYAAVGASPGRTTVSAKTE